ncbi:MAG TPA: wax ester/triacylglycerol synthase family O-acyltransferase [Solirubrobacteraceae bacterium]|nr:wax ester/triacylglycerol synthase family O-acyltransferase [Solirubrobacteraceae bacterium]
MRLSPTALLTTARRLSALDGSFLRLESADAHMHVGWSAVFTVPDGQPRPTLAALRERVDRRLDDLEWCRWRLQRAPLGLSEPRWVRDDRFDIASHVRALSQFDEAVGYERLASMRDSLLSRPLDHSRPPWEMYLVPRLEDGRMALLGKVHHSLVDGIAALQIVGLIVDEPDGDSPADEPPRRRNRISTTRRQDPIDWAIDELKHAARTGVGALNATASAATRPQAAVRSVIRDCGRVAAAARADLLTRAPGSPLNAPIGSDRTLIGYRARRELLRDARASRGGTLNDIGLTVVAGALRELAAGRGEIPSAPLKAMVPVSMRAAGEDGPGNQISMVYIQLPVHLPTPIARLDAVRAEMQGLKASGRAEGTETLYAISSLVPAPLRSPVVKALASPRVFNLTISQSPGPRGDIRVLGCEMDEVYSVVPISEQHSLAIGMVRYRRELFIGCYADPVALPEARDLPALLDAELHALAEQGSRAGGAPVAGGQPV